MGLVLAHFEVLSEVLVFPCLVNLRLKLEEKVNKICSKKIQNSRSSPFDDLMLRRRKKSRPYCHHYRTLRAPLSWFSHSASIIGNSVTKKDKTYLCFTCIFPLFSQFLSWTSSLSVTIRWFLDVNVVLMDIKVQCLIYSLNFTSAQPQPPVAAPPCSSGISWCRLSRGPAPWRCAVNKGIRIQIFWKIF